MRLITKVKAIIKDEYGNITHVQEGRNTITEGDPNSVQNGLVYMLERICAIGSYYDDTEYINRMQLGTGTPGNGGLGTPIAATLKVVNTKALDETGGSWYDDPTVIISCTWDAGYGALSAISEAGLITDTTSSYVIAYKTFSPLLSKTAPGELTLEWSIQLAYS